MALTEQVVLDIQSAQRQIDVLERQLDQLGVPINIPVNIQGEDSIDRMRRDFGRADNSVEELNRELRQTDDELRRAERAADQTGDAMLRVGTRGVSAFSNLRGSLIGVGAAFVAFQGARAFLDFSSKAVDAASDLEESTSKAQVVFGDFFSDIQDFSQTAPQALGLANSAALEFTGTFGNLFVALGLSQQAAAELAPDIVQLGADLASFNNLEVTDALDKLRAGLVGEAEPLRVLGVNLTAASTAAKAVELGLASSTTEVSEAAKVQARYAQILEQTVTAQGDFARTSDGIANRQRTLAGTFENFRAEVGEALLPVFESLLDVAPKLIDGLGNLVPVIADLAQSLATTAEDSSGFINVFGDIPNVIGGTVDVVKGGTSALGNFGLAVGNLATLNIGGFFDRFKAGLEATGDLAEDLKIRSIREDLLDLLRSGVSPLDALANSVAELGRSTSDIETFRSEVERLVAISGLSGGEASLVFRAISESAEELGLSADQVAIFLPLLRELLGVTGALPPPLDELVGGISSVGGAAEAAAPQAAGFAGTLKQFQDVDLEGLFDGVAEEFAKLPTAISAAQEALTDDEGEIVGDAATFINDLETEFGKITDFTADIQLAEALGLDDLAGQARELGLDFAPILAEAVANPETAAELESTLESFNREMAAFERASVQTALTEEFEDPLLIPLNIQFELGNITLPGAGNLLENINLGPGGTPANAGGPNVGGGVTVNQTFDNTPGPTTETERAAQQINALIGAGPQ